MRTIVLTLCLAFTVLGCDNTKKTTTETKVKAKPAAAETVTVSKTGTTFDPPVQIAQIPPGAHYCDMGTVHYARLDKGDGKCTECGMMLKTKPGKAKEADGHAGHQH